MTQRTCKTCRWWNRHSGLATGDCQKRPPNSITSKWPSTDEVDWCGEWQDASITPEQAERRELVRRFALAIVEGVYANPDDVDVHVMLQAKRYADRFIEAMQEGQT